jgi:hypothetical protein
MNERQTTRDPKFGRRRVIWALVGSMLIVSGIFLAWSFASKELNDFYFIPRDEGDRILPRRWQDLLMLGVVWSFLFAWFWSGYRLIKYALRPRTEV